MSGRVGQWRKRRRDAASRSEHERLLLDSGIADVEYYRAQSGLDLADAPAVVRHYLEAGSRRGYSLHPLFEAEYLDIPPGATPDAAVRYLTDRKLSRTSPHPAYDLSAGGPWLSWITAATPETVVPRPGATEEVTWGDLRNLLVASASIWRENRVGAARLDASPRPAAPDEQPVDNAPLVSVVIVWGSDPATRAAARAALDQSLTDIEVVAVGDGSHADAVAVAAGLSHFDDRLRWAGVADSPAAALNRGLAEARGRYVAFADPATPWPTGFLSGAVAQLESGAQDALPAARDLGSVVVRSGFARRLGFEESLRGAAATDFLLRLPGADPALASGLPAGSRALVQAGRELDWSAAADTVPSRLSVIAPVRRDLAAAASLTGLLASRADTELVYVGTPTRAQYCALSALGAGRPVRVVASTVDTWALLADLGALSATGSSLLFVGPGAVVEPSAVAPLVDALDEPGVAVVQPLNQRLHLTVASAGAYFAPGQVVPVPLLAGHPLPDAERMGDRDLPAAYSAVVAVRTSDFVALRGFDPGFANSLAEVDLSLRALQAGRGGTRLRAGARITARSREKAGFAPDPAASARRLQQRWRTPPSGSPECLDAAGFAVVTHRAEPLPGTAEPEQPTYACEPGLAPTRSLDGPVPCFRWAIDIAATATWWGARWGDRYFAYSLAAALRRLGQQASVDHREVRDRQTRTYDDVVLVLRGVDRVTPVPGPINLMWVISHPDDVDPEEAARYDRVLAAGPAWAARRSAEWGLPILPMLQCTDAGLFHPGRADGRDGAPVLFVGNARQGASRPVVDDALDAGVRLDLYGTGWERTRAAGRLVAELAPNDELGAMYAAAGVVLNDHWPDMRRAGFVSNRLFDAVACGARVLSDRVPGAEELFGSSVRFFDSPADVARLLSDPDRHWPARDERLTVARRVLAEHSFDRRAEQLLAEATRIHRERRSAGLRPR